MTMTLKDKQFSKGFSRRAKLSEKYGREAVRKAIAQHKAAGNPIYFSDKNGGIVKELADGRQFLIEVSLVDGSETIEKQIR